MKEKITYIESDKKDMCDNESCFSLSDLEAEIMKKTWDDKLKIINLNLLSENFNVNIKESIKSLVLKRYLIADKKNTYKVNKSREQYIIQCTKRFSKEYIKLYV